MYSEMDKTVLVRKSIEEIKSDSPLKIKDINTVLCHIYNFSVHGREDKNSQEKENKHFKYIPWSIRSFTYMIKFIQKRVEAKKFIDVGCGIGDKVVLAYLFGNFEKVTGIELNETTYHVAKYFLGNGMFYFEKYNDYYENHRESRANPDRRPTETKIKRRIIYGDAFDHDFSEYDFIYLYVPIDDPVIMSKLHKKILLEMPIGGIIIDVSFSNNLISSVNIISKKVTRKGRGFAYYIKRKSKNEYEEINYSEKDLYGA